MNRRGFLITLSGLVAAPAIVKADNIMRILVPPKPLLIERDGWLLCNGAEVPTARFEALSSLLDDLGGRLPTFDRTGAAFSYWMRYSPSQDWPLGGVGLMRRDA